jgi:alpha-methylacyl-CoA racemase
MKAVTPLQAPLSGVRIVEFEGIGPGPLAGQMLVGMGADVTVIARPQRGALNERLGGQGDNPMRRGKRVVLLDLKQPDALAQAIALVAGADALIEGNRPGVMERLGLGPADCAAHNPVLVYGRMTGWGQSGPLAQAAGHDLNYVALTGLLSLSAYRGQRPILPPTVVGDAAGALGLAFGIVCALLDARRSGTGRVVDGAIVDVVAMLGGIAQMVRAAGQIDGPGPSPFHDAPFYDVYSCAEGGYITLGALEPQFYALLLTWPALKARFGSLFAGQSRAHWCALLEGTDVCFAPVLSLAEAVHHPHNRARGIYRTDATGAIETTAAPRFRAL